MQCYGILWYIVLCSTRMLPHLLCSCECADPGPLTEASSGVVRGADGRFMWRFLWRWASDVNTTGSRCQYNNKGRSGNWARDLAHHERDHTTRPNGQLMNLPAQSFSKAKLLCCINRFSCITYPNYLLSYYTKVRGYSIMVWLWSGMVRATHIFTALALCWLNACRYRWQRHILCHVGWAVGVFCQGTWF